MQPGHPLPGWLWNRLMRRAGLLAWAFSLALLLAVLWAGPVLSAGGEQITFVSLQEGQPHIYLLDVRSRLLTHLAGPLRLQEHPIWSPDGRHLAYLETGPNWDGSSDLYVLNVETGALRRLTADAHLKRSPAWSPDGSRLAYVLEQRGQDQELYIIGLEDGAAWALTADEADNWGPAWSPDGQQIAFVMMQDGNQDLYLLDVLAEEQAATPRPRRLTVHPAGDAQPIWSPDGRQIAFISQREGNWDIYLLGVDHPPAEGGAVRRLTQLGAHGINLSWSPLGQIILALNYQYSSRSLAAVDLTTGELTQFVHTGAVFSPSISPDGGQVMYVSSRSGQAEIYTVDAAGGTARLLATGTGEGAWSPAWRP